MPSLPGLNACTVTARCAGTGGALARREAIAVLLPVAEVYLRHLAAASAEEPSQGGPAPTSAEQHPLVATFRGPLLAYVAAKQGSRAGELHADTLLVGIYISQDASQLRALTMGAAESITSCNITADGDGELSPDARAVLDRHAAPVLILCLQLAQLEPSRAVATLRKLAPAGGWLVAPATPGAVLAASCRAAAVCLGKLALNTNEAASCSRVSNER